MWSVEQGPATFRSFAGAAVCWVAHGKLTERAGLYSLEHPTASGREQAGAEAGHRDVEQVMAMKELGTKAVQVLFQVMETPLFVRLLQNRRVLLVLSEGLSLPARTRELVLWSGERMARRFGWATADDLRQLEQDLLQRYQDTTDQGTGSASRVGTAVAGQGGAGLGTSVPLAKG